MSFLFQSLLWLGLPLIAAPLLIHLINLRRYERVQWAAMDFLLESQKRNKNWIRLRQFLLLLLRTAAIACVALMLAGPVLMSQWGSLLGSGQTHHIMLLDDTYSMGDRWNETTAWDEAKQAVDQVLEQAVQGAGTQKLTLLRFSEAMNASVGQKLEFGDAPIDRESLEQVNSLLDEQAVSETAVGPVEALQAVLGLPMADAGESKIVYVISDFRRRQWANNPQAKQLLSQLRERVDELQLVQCVDQTRPNLAITGLEPESGIRAAGVETWMQLRVANYGDEPAVAIPVSITQDGHKLPAAEFDEIGPGEEVVRRFRVAFPSAGAHELEAQLPADSLATDNRRFFASEVPGTFPILIINGSSGGDDGFYLRTALAPGGTSKPGWSPRVEPPSFLRDHSHLQEFAAIFLLDVPRLDDAEVSTLEDFVKRGGGLAIFLGPESQRTFYNEQLYRDGTGLMPFALDVPAQLLTDGREGTADVKVTDHPVFRVFAGQRNNFLPVAQVNFYYATVPQVGDKDPDTRVIAELENGAPFVVEKKFGDGRVVVQFCKLSPQSTSLGVWSNWSLNPVFPVVANELAGYLTANARKADEQEIGRELTLELAEEDYEPDVVLRAPESEAERTLTPQTRDGQYLYDGGPGMESGVWQFGLQPRQQAPARKLLAVNVANGEGDLHHLDRQTLAKELEGVNYKFALAAQMKSSDDQLAGFRLGDSLLMALVAALLIEQWLAYKASYHAPSGGRR